jgi:hypothetical protein
MKRKADPRFKREPSTHPEPPAFSVIRPALMSKPCLRIVKTWSVGWVSNGGCPVLRHGCALIANDGYRPQGTIARGRWVPVELRHPPKKSNAAEDSQLVQGRLLGQNY